MTIPTGHLLDIATAMYAVAAMPDTMALTVMSTMIVMMMTMGVVTSAMVMRWPRRGR
jgi:hypothetical protein